MKRGFVIEVLAEEECTFPPTLSVLETHGPKRSPIAALRAWDRLRERQRGDLRGTYLNFKRSAKGW